MKSLDKERRKLEKAGFTGQTLERAMELLEQVRQDFLSFSQREKQTNFTFSCGLEYRGQAADLSDLYRAADHKLYQAKRSGRDAVVFFETAPAL